MPEIHVNLGRSICIELSTFPVLKSVRFLPCLMHFWLLIFFNFQTFGYGIEFCFDGSKEGYRLDSNVTKYLHAQTGVDCIFQCMLQDELCRSVNFRKSADCEGKENCELLYDVSSEKPEFLRKFTQFDYYVLLQPKRTGLRLATKRSCKELLDEDPTLVDGIYILTAKNSSKTFPVYCHMTEPPGCTGRGWTLVMKIDGNNQTFSYDSQYWTNMESYAVENGLEGLTLKESKLASYWNTPFKKICLGMSVDGNRKWMILDYDASSLYSVIADGKYRSTSSGRAAWKSLIADSSLQPNCNEEGLDIFYGQVKMRLGYLANNQNRCQQADSCIGFGISYSACGITSHITCGNIAQCSSNDKGKKMTAAFGYILVQ